MSSTTMRVSTCLHVLAMIFFTIAQPSEGQDLTTFFAAAEFTTSAQTDRFCNTTIEVEFETACVPCDLSGNTTYSVFNSTDSDFNSTDIDFNSTDSSFNSTDSDFSSTFNDFNSTDNDTYLAYDTNAPFRNISCPQDSEIVVTSTCVPPDGTLGANFDPSINRFCATTCRRSEIQSECCSGFFGISCRECPRGLNNMICSGKGTCSDRRTGDGTCQCYDDFSGLVCELCKNSSMFGPNCSEECRCVNGTCDSGPSGSGACLQCFPGYSGPLCSDKINICDILACSNNSICEEIDDKAQCVCQNGYEKVPGLNETICQAIDRCRSASLCGVYANCIPTGPGTFQCRCQPGYEGDGYMCRPIDPCQNANGGCDNTTTICINSAPNSSYCDCLAGYENLADGTRCSLIDICHRARCHAKATCVTLAPNEIRCTCMKGYVGDGITCYGNIIETLEELNRKHPTQRGQLNMALDLLQTIYQKPFSEHGPFTVFVPINRAFRKASSQFPYEKMLQQIERSQQIMRQHVVLGRMAIEDFQKYSDVYTLQGTVAEMRVARDLIRFRMKGYPTRARVLERDISASNGIIHIVNEVLINDSPIIGSNKMTAMELIKFEGRFNRLQTLITSLGLESSFENNNITIFAPENGGLDNLPEGSLLYLTTEQDGKIKLKTILENHIFPGMIDVTDLINRPRIRSLANYVTEVSITNIGRIQLNKKVNISQVNIPCKNAAYYHIDGPLIPPEIAQILPSRCDVQRNMTVKGACTACNVDFRCPLSTDIFSGEITEGCNYWGVLQGRITQVKGCQPLCLRTTMIPQCCDGFYGKDCNPCPGGYKNPCNGRGKCSDGMHGIGLCFCSSGFRGPVCEQCLDNTKFGPNCTQDCTCVHGVCNGGPTGSGTCKKDSCASGYMGENCNKKKVYCAGRYVVCNKHASCVSTSPGVLRCECNSGYEGDGQVCQEINPCEKPGRGGCHLQATCTKVGPGAHQCKCDSGWFGDGFSCQPVTPCDKDTDCPDNAGCHNLEPGKYSCMCDEGFEGNDNGTFCKEINACLQNNGGCDAQAKCTPSGPGIVNCTCPTNYFGDGIRCVTTLAGHILTNGNLTLLAQFLQKQNPNNSFLGDIGESLTFFAPSDDAIRSFTTARKVPRDYFSDNVNVMNFFSFHTLGNPYSLADLLELEGRGGLGRFETFFDGYSVRVFVRNKTAYVLSTQTTSASVIVSDIVATNGYLHIIDRVLEPFLPDASQPYLRDFFENNPDFSNFGLWLSRKGLVEELQAMDKYTLFVPNNTVFTPETFNHSITADYLKYYILQSIVLTPAVDNNQSVDTLLGSKHQLLFRTIGDKVFVNNVEIVEANVMTMEGVVHIIGGLLVPVLNFCNKQTITTSFGLCGACFNYSALLCDEGFRIGNSSYVQRHHCKYTTIDDDGDEHKFLGCRRLCEREESVVQCCAGHYGAKCSECPGGAETPCSGRGTCDEGMQSSGVCACDKPYVGLQCEFCLDWNMAGPFCNISKQSCGYQNGNCSNNAECEDIEGGSGVHCRCYPGYVGDGYLCTSPCDTQNGGCHSDANCTVQIPEQTVQCSCNPGYYGNGTWCKENVDLCKQSTCSPYAYCQLSSLEYGIENGEVICICLDGYVGNGSLCVTTVWNALSQISTVSRFYKGLMDCVDVDNITSLLNDSEATITLFVPVDEDPIFFSDPNNYYDYIIPETLVINQELVNDNSSEFFTISGLPLLWKQIGDQFYVNGIRLIERNIPSTNGYINLLEHSFHQMERQTAKSISDIVATAVSLSLLLITGVIIAVVFYYRHTHTSGIMDFVKRFRQGSDASMSFARLQAQEDDDGPNPFIQPDNVNFDNPLYNDPDTL